MLGVSPPPSQLLIVPRKKLVNVLFAAFGTNDKAQILALILSNANTMGS